LVFRRRGLDVHLSARLLTMKSALLLVISAHTGVAQCSMCRSSAQAAQSAALNNAILVLFFPAILLFCAIAILTFRYTRDAHTPSIASDSPPDVEST
jgi:hypothetical protein